MRNSLILLLLLVIRPCYSSPGDSLYSIYNKKNPVIEARFHYGKIVRNYGNMPDRREAGLFELFVGKQTNGEKDWQQIYGLPQTGVSFFYGGLGNNAVLGSVFGIVPNITFGSASKKKWNVKVTLGIGFAYFNKPYNTVSNEKNEVIGSSITNMSMAELYLQRNLTPRLSLTGGFLAMHCSNGHYQVPNVGMNLPALNIGLKYYPETRNYDFPRREVTVPKGKIRLNVRFGMGIHEFAGTFGPVGGPKYTIYHTSVYLSKRYGRVSNVYAGFEAKYYTDFYQYIVKNDYFPSHPHMNATVLTYFMAHELMIHKLGFLLEGGLELYNPFYKKYHSDEANKTIFDFLETYTSSKIGLQYYLFDPKYCNAPNVFLGLFVKANFGQADYVGTNIGVSF